MSWSDLKKKEKEKKSNCKNVTSHKSPGFQLYDKSGMQTVARTGNRIKTYKIGCRC